MQLSEEGSDSNWACSLVENHLTGDKVRRVFADGAIPKQDLFAKAHFLLRAAEGHKQEQG